MPDIVWRAIYLIPFLTLFMYKVNIELNKLTRVHNYNWLKKMEAYNRYKSSGGSFAMRDKAIADLSFTIYENWSIFSIYNSVLINQYLLPNELISPLEVLLSYIIILYGILWDFMLPNSLRHRLVKYLLIILTIHLNAKILGIDLFLLIVTTFLS